MGRLTDELQEPRKRRRRSPSYRGVDAQTPAIGGCAGRRRPKIVREINEFDNLYFEVCNEPYFGGVAQDWQYRIADTIIETEKDLPHKHLISLNIANGRKKVDVPHPTVSIFNFHYCVPPDTVAMNYGLNKVIGENETGFRGKDDFLYRSEGWDFLLAGGGCFWSTSLRQLRQGVPRSSGDRRRRTGRWNGPTSSLAVARRQTPPRFTCPESFPPRPASEQNAPEQ